MANTTGTALVNDLLLKWGNLALSVYGELFVNALNDAIEDFATGDYTFQFPELEKQLTVPIPTGSQNPQAIGITSYTDLVWIPISWHDITNDEPLVVANEGMADIEIDRGAAATRVNRYYLWGDILYIVPPLSTSITIRLTYIGQAAKLMWNSDTSSVEGSSPFKTQWDEGLKLAACTRVAPTLNPDLESNYQAQLARWTRRRISQNTGSHFNREHTIWPQLT